MEDRLLKILHTGLPPQKLGHRAGSVDSMGGYYNIQDLKNLLESRKACWQPETSPGLHSLGGVPTHNECHELISRLSEATQSPVESLISHLKGSDALSMSENRTNPKQTSSNNVFRDSRRDQFPSDEVDGSKRVPPLFQPRLRAQVHPNLAGPDVGDDDIFFFQELDAAYCAILEPDRIRNQPLEEGLVECNKSHLLISFQSHNQDLSPAGSIHTLSCGQVGLDVLTTFANSSHRPHEELAAIPSHGNFTKMNASEVTSPREGFLPAPEALLKSHGGDRPPSNTDQEPCSRIPPGFWRQKRLY